jgi:hypothetical protein
VGGRAAEDRRRARSAELLKCSAIGAFLSCYQAVIAFVVECGLLPWLPTGYWPKLAAPTCAFGVATFLLGAAATIGASVVVGENKDVDG